MSYLSANSKLRKSGVLSWAIPAYKSSAGFRTCPGASSCIRGCYARQGCYRMSTVKRAMERRLALSVSPDFVDTLVAEIGEKRPRFVRVHDSGDFYSPEYLADWVRIMRACPETRFYCYTKMVPLLKAAELPENFTVIFSLGGRWDDQVDVGADRHAAVFDSTEALLAAGYADAHGDDLVALGDNPKIGLIYHGSYGGHRWRTQ